MEQRRKESPQPAGRPVLLGLLQECKDHPDEDSPRLILADWLEEHGDESERARAELIRLQIEHEQQAPDTPGWSVQQEREHQLIQQYRSKWETPLEAVGSPYWAWPPRGLVFPSLKKRGHRTAKALALAGSEAFAWVEGFSVRWPSAGDIERLIDSPLFTSITGLQILGTTPRANEIISFLARSPRARHLRSLALIGIGMDDDGISHLAASRYLTGLRSLVIDSNDITPVGHETLFHSPVVANLTSLQRSAGNHGREAVRAIASSPHLRNLKRLNLRGSDLAFSDFSTLLDSPNASKLLRLDLSSNEVRGQGCYALAASTHLQHLVTLDLSNTRIRSNDLDLLARARLDNLRSLVLNDNDIDSSGVDSLISHRTFPALTGLHLESNPLRNEGAEVLATAKHWQLTYLNLDDCHIGGAGLTALGGWPGLASVRTLSLARNQVGLTGIQGLLGSPWLLNLRALDLSDASLGDRAVQALVRSPSLAGLEFLNLAANRAGVGAAQSLIDSPYLANLQHLNLYRIVSSSDSTRRALRKRFGKRLTM